MLVYIHIPYCDSKCHYCSFNSYVDKFDTRERYMQALKLQLLNDLKQFKAGKGCIETLFIGGGTPSTVSFELYEPIFNILSTYFKKDAEITVEANPNSATYLWLKGMKNLGVNRVSFGVQSFDTKKLKALNRSHTPQQAEEAILNAKKVGFEHISLDIIYNFKDDTKEILKKDIDKAFTLPIDHISAYELTIESHTAFASTPEVKLDSDELAFFVSDKIKENGFKQYEISNYGNYESKHNKGYWSLKNYMGIGSGAVGFFEDRRYYPHTNIDAYIEEPLYAKKELLSHDELLTEHILLGLRSSIGVKKSILTKAMQEKADFLCEEKKLIYDTNSYYNSNFFLTDALALYILD